MKPSFIIDLIILLILLMAIGSGAKKGLIRMAAALVSLLAGYSGAWGAALLLSKPVGNRFFLPWVSESIAKAAAGSYNPVDDALNQMTEIGADAEAAVMNALADLGLPAFSISDIFGTLLDKITGTGRDVLTAAAEVVSQRLAFVLIFIITFLIIQLTVLFVANNLEGLTKLPLLSPVNRIGGAACGAILAAFLILALLWIVMTFFPAFTSGDGFLSRQALKESRIIPLLMEAARKMWP